MSVVDNVKLAISNTVSKARNIGNRTKYVIRESAKPAGEPIVFNSSPGGISFLVGCVDPGAKEEIPCDGIDQDGDGKDYIPDEDNDGYSTCYSETQDCDDNNDSVYPGAPEIECDGIDQDCDGVDYTPDNDGDGYTVCDDCDDGDANTYPGAEELCDGLDNDCDGIHENDSDGDGFLACEECDDTYAFTYPGAEELCDEIDNDCDGVIPADEFDCDGDGYLACEECDDNEYYINPGMTEDWCNGIDDNCDGIYETDADGDGYFIECDDCDDNNNLIYPGASEIECDWIDQDCDGQDLVNELLGQYNLSFATTSFIGEDEDDNAGLLPNINGDMNGDGYDDILIGAPFNDEGGYRAGKAYVFYNLVAGTMELDAAEVSLIGENAEDDAGSSVSTGDINGDGYDDVLVGAKGNDDGGAGCRQDIRILFSRIG